MTMIHCQLWMGSLEPYMTESFIMNSFRKMGENPQTVKVMRNKFTGEPAGYCFVHFANDEEAIDAMHKLNGKPIPGTSPVVRFRLNNASNTGRTPLDREFSVWVGDLSPDVDDYNLYRAFASKYNTIKTAKVILDSSGFSKGYGFVRFGSEEEQKNSLTAMNGYVGLGSKALKICNAVPKLKGPPTTPPHGSSGGSGGTTSGSYAPPTEYASQYYDPAVGAAQYWGGYGTWGQYYTGGEEPQAQEMPTYGAPVQQEAPVNTHTQHEHELELVEHSLPVDVDALNRELAEQDAALWDAIETSKWLPCEALQIA